ncbi:unnamed protein product, partial [Musa acuminata var. zebrina]
GFRKFSKRLILFNQTQLKRIEQSNQPAPCTLCQKGEVPLFLYNYLLDVILQRTLSDKEVTPN